MSEQGGGSLSQRTRRLTLGLSVSTTWVACNHGCSLLLCPGFFGVSRGHLPREAPHAGQFVDRDTVVKGGAKRCDARFASTLLEQKEGLTEILPLFGHVSGPHRLGVVDRHLTDAYRPPKSFLPTFEQSTHVLHRLDNQLDRPYLLLCRSPIAPSQHIGDRSMAPATVVGGVAMLVAWRVRSNGPRGCVARASAAARNAHLEYKCCALHGSASPP